MLILKSESVYFYVVSKSMKKIILSAAFCLSATVSQYSSAGITVLDFDGFADGQIINDEYSATYGVDITSVNYIDGVIGNGNDVEGRQVAFNTLNDSSSDNDLEYNNSNNDYNDAGSAFQYTALNLPGYVGDANPGNILILQENATGCGDGICNDPDDEGSRAAGYFEFTFANIVSILNIDFFDVEDQNGNDQFNAIHFFDDTDTEIHLGNYTPIMGDGEFVRQSYSGITGVKRLIINLPGSGAIDNLAFKTTDVPEPSTFVVLALGLIFMVRRQLK